MLSLIERWQPLDNKGKMMEIKTSLWSWMVWKFSRKMPIWISLKILKQFYVENLEYGSDLKIFFLENALNRTLNGKLQKNIRTIGTWDYFYPCIAALNHNYYDPFEKKIDFHTIKHFLRIKFVGRKY